MKMQNYRMLLINKGSEDIWIKDVKRYLALFKNEKCLGKIEAGYLYSKLTNGPCIVEYQKIQD